MSVILLVDNGSVRAAATKQLRKLAHALSQHAGQTIHPVSFKHANKIKAEEIDNIPADIFSTFMEKQLSQGEREFILLPLFFGASKALTSFVPEQIELLKQRFGDFYLRIADVVYPLPDGDKHLVDIVHKHITETARIKQLPLNNIVLVDHGSPIPTVTAVRKHLTIEVQKRLGDTSQLDEAVMERREGKRYDFNGDLLESWLTKKAQSGENSAIVVLLFFLPGRHAGIGGDIVEICEGIMDKYPDFNIAISPLISENELLIPLLHSRLLTTPAIKRLPCRGCTENCNLYSVCGGKPWRLSEAIL